jgi:hypothetical protein
VRSAERGAVLADPGRRFASRRSEAGLGVARAGRLEIIPESALAEVIPGEQASALPFLAAQSVAVRDLDVARKILEGNGVDTREMPGGLFVPAADAFGASVGFVAA